MGQWGVAWPDFVHRPISFIDCQGKPAIATAMIHLRQLIALLIAIFGSLAVASPAQQRLPTPVAIEAVAVAPALRPALWKVSDADTTIYLFGTIHALPKGIEWFDGAIANALESSGELVTEIPAMDVTQVQSNVVRLAVLPQGQSLRALLRPAAKAAYEAAMIRYGLPVAAFDRYKPWYAAVALSALPLMRDGFATENGVEAALDQRAKALGRKHSGLETIEYQLGLFDALPQATQITYLNEVVQALPTLRAELGIIVTQWGQGNAEKLAELMNAQEDDPAMLEALLTGRNRNWARWIKARMDRPGTVFMAVGAGHLAGNGSVQDQLAAQGIATTRVQ